MADHESGPLTAQQILDYQQQAATGATAPWWVAAMKTWGVGAGIGIFLVGFLVQVVIAKLDAADAKQDATNAKIEKLGEDQRLGLADTRYLLRSICLNTATNEAQRAGCVLPGRAR